MIVCLILEDKREKSEFLSFLEEIFFRIFIENSVFIVLEKKKYNNNGEIDCDEG